MLKNIASLESKVGEWESCWNLLPNTPLEVCKEMLFQFQKYIGAVEDAVKSQIAQEEAQKAAEEPKVEELKAE